MALKGGCKWIQLRMKNASDEEIGKVALEILPLCRESGATFILDDRVGLALEIGADGVHLGKDDMPVREARKILGHNFIIGGTANTVEDIRRLNGEGADYIGCGPFRHTTTKERLAPVLGEESYKNIVRIMKEEKITLPIIGIGGITAEDIPLLHSAGLDGIALSGDVLRSPDPISRMREIMNIARQL